VSTGLCGVLLLAKKRDILVFKVLLSVCYFPHLSIIATCVFFLLYLYCLNVLFYVHVYCYAPFKLLECSTFLAINTSDYFGSTTISCRVTVGLLSIRTTFKLVCISATKPYLPANFENSEVVKKCLGGATGLWKKRCAKAVSVSRELCKVK